MKDSLLEPFYFRNIPETKAMEEITHYLNYFSLGSTNLDNSSLRFSGGELQRLSILRAFFFKPEVILMDEPVSGLDRLVLYDTIDFINKLISLEKITVFIVSHDLEFISNIANYTYILKKGSIVDQGTSEIFINPQNDYTKLLIQARDLSNLKDSI